MHYDAPAAYARLIAPRYLPIAEALAGAARLRPVDDALELGAGAGPRARRGAARLRPVDDALELGAGTGLVTRRVAPLVRSLVATDRSAAMLDVARAATSRDTRVTFVLVDYNEPLPFLDRSFDLVLSGLTYV